MAVNGSVLQFSPVVIVRLEWQAPFSHTGHHILYYTVYTAHSTETNVADVSHELHIDSGEFSSCKAYIAVSATNDVGESKLSVVTSILKGLYGTSCKHSFVIFNMLTKLQYQELQTLLLMGRSSPQVMGLFQLLSLKFK